MKRVGQPDHPIIVVARWIDSGEGAGGELVRAGLRRWIASGERLRADHLSLPSRADGLRREIRDAYLRAAAVELRGPPTVRAKLLARSIELFSSTTWPAWSAAGGPPAWAPAPLQALFNAFGTGAPVPRSWRRLVDILE